MATQTLELEPDAFWRMVTEENLKVDGPSAGFMWAGKRGKTGWEMYKARAQPIGWLYQARRVATQGNVAGGAVAIDIAIPTGVVAQIISFNATNSGTNTVSLSILDEDNNTARRLAFVASGAATHVHVPSIGSAPTSSANFTSDANLYVGPGQKLAASQSGAGAQADTFTVVLVLLLSVEVTPTWDKSRSTNQADVTLAASTISAANTLQAVYL